MAGITLLTRFMLEFGFPWLALVKGTQSNNAEVINLHVGVCTSMVPGDR